MKRFLIDYLYIATGAFILAIGISCFLVPMKLSTGGVSGVGTVLYYFFNVPLSVTTLVINAGLFVMGYRMLKKEAIFKTLAGILFLALFLEITGLFGTYTEDRLIASLFGGILAGIGVGLTVIRGASTGGSDFAALMINKRMPHVSVATVIMIIDGIVITLSGIAFKDYTVMFYSVISLYVAGRVTDFIMVRGNWAKSVYIISEKHEEIARAIIEDMDRGVTGIYGKGIYENKDKMLLMCIVKGREIPNLLERIKSLDGKAFTVIADVKEVHGEGFK
ncbi:MAG: YitT family protein [Clostridia bacterium]|nr:YitT family protein [Clostridia bacterium]